MSFNKDTGMYEGFIYCIENKINGKNMLVKQVGLLK